MQKSYSAEVEAYLARHPETRFLDAVMFDLVDELMEAAEANAFHAGMDEVFLLGEDDCPRCRGKNKAELFAGEVKAIHSHLARKGRKLWMWGDRFLDGDATGLGRWEASTNNTAAAIHLVRRKTMLAAMAPLVSDPPIVTLCLLVLSQVPAWFQRFLYIAGGLFILYLAYGAYKAWKGFEANLPNSESETRQSSGRRR